MALMALMEYKELMEQQEHLPEDFTYPAFKVSAGSDGQGGSGGSGGGGGGGQDCFFCI
jgi:hypothetical protein